MKKFPGLVSIVLFLNLCFFPPNLNADSKSLFPASEPDISMDFQDASLKDVLKVFSIQSGLNFIASEGLQDRKVTLYLDRVPLNTAMDKLFKANNLSYDLDKDSNIFIVKDLGKAQIETVTKVFYLKYATVSSSSLKEDMSSIIKSGSGAGGGIGKWKVEDETGITQVVKKLLSPSGSVIEDFRTNSLIVTDTPNRIPIIAQVIASLDVSIPQVLLEVEMLDVNKNVVDKLGVTWPTTLLSLDVTGQRTTNFPFFGGKADNRQWLVSDENAITSPSGKWKFSNFYSGHFLPSVLTVIGANLTLDFLRNQSDTKFLARPRLLTLNNETAEIKIATNEAIGIKQTTSASSGAVGSATAEAERTETGVILRVTPQINVESGEITMFIYPKVSEAVPSSISSDLGSFKDPEERSTKTMVRIKDGETVVIGGLLRQEVSRNESKLPFFGDLPLIGFLFKHSGGTSSTPDKNKERELLVFITPHIVNDADIKLAKVKQVVLPVREQSAASAVSRESEVSASLNSFEGK